MEVVMGMTCAACHTRQIEVASTAYRIDGGPALVEIHKRALIEYLKKL
jgi:hypothetical protein